VLLTKYYSGNQIRRMRWVGNVAHMGKKIVEYRMLIVKPEGKRQLGRHRHR
jgi:hypothetical protein